MVYEIAKDTVVNGIYGVLFGGTYSDYELVTCYVLGQNEEPFCAYEPRYVVFGPETYQNDYGAD
jgi:hypothetical protein